MAIRCVASRKTLAGLKETSSRLSGFRGIHTFMLPDLPYDYGALEPAISGEIMQIHHQKHHQAYVTNYNNALEQLDQAVNKGDASTVVNLQSAIKFNGGVHEKFGRFFRGMLEEGVYFGPSQFEAGFTSLAHTREDIEFTVAAARRVLGRI
ncbi:unnamed protein product [Arabidopsis arenosa]|uniref:superoxide dismutase n=1 Tax=Arabidopsis arenosa TaxID=38785 RepID=A0A8S1ZNM6_ARAAE|nr:unnamed protein product [Arabidopsis arenosa]